MSDDDPIMLFHWAPTTRRKGIARYGLMPGKWSIDRTWKPPYVAFAHSPSWAWALSGGHGRGRTIDSWDLWMTWDTKLTGYELLGGEGEPMHEYRVYERVRKPAIWFVGTRTQAGDRAMEASA